MEANTTADVTIEWIVRRDYPEVLDIENDLFEFPWSKDAFIHCMRQRNCIGMTAKRDGRIVAFMVYELHATRLHVLNFAVMRDFQRMEIGRQMVQKLVSKLSQKRRTHILLEVRETNVAAQLFFRQMGFKAKTVLRQWYDDTPEDAYQFRYDVRNAVMQPQANRSGK